MDSDTAQDIQWKRSITGNLTADKIEKLNLIGMVWNVNGGKFSRAYEELKLYHDTYGNLDIKAKYVSPSGFALGRWVSNLRSSVKMHGIDLEEKQTIVACGAGASTKRVWLIPNPDGTHRIDRCENVKDVGQYIARIDEMIERKQRLFEE